MLFTARSFLFINIVMLTPVAGCSSADGDEKSEPPRCDDGTSTEARVAEEPQPAEKRLSTLDVPCGRDAPVRPAKWVGDLAIGQY